MTEALNTKQQYAEPHLLYGGVRLTSRYVFYDPDRGLHLWREWPEGAIVTDSEQIELLEAHNAPIERIETTQRS